MVLASSTRSAIVSILSLPGLLDQFLDHGLGLEIAGEVLHQRAVDLDEIERHGRE